MVLNYSPENRKILRLESIWSLDYFEKLNEKNII